jgi:hypothetical protein
MVGGDSPGCSPEVRGDTARWLRDVARHVRRGHEVVAAHHGDRQLVDGRDRPEDLHGRRETVPHPPGCPTERDAECDLCSVRPRRDRYRT